jgi:peptidoglycan/LPS O-acetylase OafA/YrhL
LASLFIRKGEDFENRAGGPFLASHRQISRNALAGVSVENMARDQGETRRISATRATELDGLRGWAALSVVVFHVSSETFGVLFPVLRHPILQMFANGNLAVCVFFILSGEALSIKFFETRKDIYPVTILIKRYTRLTIPIFFSCLTVLLLYYSHMTFNIAAGAIVKRTDWLGIFLTENISIKSFIQYCFVNVYDTVPLPQAFNPFLWTMRVELIGSLIVLLVLLGWNRLNNKLWLAVLATVCLEVTVPGGYIPLFFVGMAFAWLRTVEPLSERAGRIGNGWLPLILVFVTLAAITLCNRLGLVPFRVEQLFAPFLVFFALKSRIAVAFLRRPFSQFLGKISFPIYLAQFPVIISLMSWMIVRAGAGGAIAASTVASIIAVSLGACVLLAMLFLIVEKIAGHVGTFMVVTFTRAQD